MSVTSNHPNPNTLTDYALGRLPDDTLESVGAHVEACSECQETLSNLDASDDTLIRAVASATPDDPFADEQECAAAMAAIREFGDAADGDATRATPTADRDASDETLGTLRDYQLLSKLGEGGMGAVYRALHLRLDRLVALKVLPAERMRHGDAVSRFGREMKAVGNLDHPNIVQAHDAGEVDGKHFLVMELVDGVDLGALVDREGPLPVEDACELIRQAAIGLHHAHQHGLVHRDVKPSNLMLNRAGMVKVLDLGLARLLGEEQTADRTATEAAIKPSDSTEHVAGELTAADQIMGTPDYMAPEQLSDSRAVDARSDVYSLGATLYKLLTGRAPFAGEQYNTLAKKLIGLAENDPSPIEHLRAGLPDELVRIVQRMLAKDPADRCANAARVAEDLAPFCKDQDVRRFAEATPSAEGMSAPTVERMELETQPQGVDPLTHDTSGRRGGGLKWLIGAAAAGFAAVAALVIYVQTNNGMLEIRSQVPEEIKVEILNGQVVVRQPSIRAKANGRIKLPVGDYQVRLQTGDGDQITIDNDQVKLRRGQTEIVTLQWQETQVVEQPNSKVSPASPDIRRRYNAMRYAFHALMSPQQLEEFLGRHAPMLRAFDSASVVAVVEFAAKMPQSAQDSLLDDRYVRWRFDQLDADRQALVRRAVTNILVKSLNVQSTNDSGDPAFASWFDEGEYGYAVLTHPKTNQQAVVAYFSTPDVTMPMILPIAGRIGDGDQHDPREWARQIETIKDEWPRQLASLKDKPFSDRLPPLAPPEPTVIASFTPGDDVPINDDAIVTEQNGEWSAWRIEDIASESPPNSVRLFEVVEADVEDCLLTYRVHMRTRDVRARDGEGSVYLEMWVKTPGGVEAFSKGLHHKVSGTNDWATYETPFLLRTGQPAERIKLNIVIEGAGTVWINKVELLSTPARITGE